MGTGFIFGFFFMLVRGCLSAAAWRLLCFWEASCPVSSDMGSPFSSPICGWFRMSFPVHRHWYSSLDFFIDVFALGLFGVFFVSSLWYSRGLTALLIFFFFLVFWIFRGLPRSCGDFDGTY